MTWRLVLGASTLLISAASAVTMLNPDHPCSQLIMERYPEKILGELGAAGQNTINRIKTPDIEEQPVQQPVDEQFSPRQAGTTALHCVTITVQGVPSTVKYVAGSVAGSVVESFNQGEPQRALGDFVSASKGLAQEAHLAFNQHLQSTLAGLQQRQ
jgi:hypothetical protein